MDNMTLHNMVKTGGDGSEYLELANTYKQQAEQATAELERLNNEMETIIETAIEETITNIKGGEEMKF